MKNILIAKTAALGDVLRTTVILEGLKEKYVNSKIYWLTKKSAKPLLENNPLIEEIYYKEEIRKNIFTRNYDLIISLEEDKEVLDLVNKLKKKALFGIYIKNNKLKYTLRSSPWNDMSLISRFGKYVADELKKSNFFSFPELLYKMLDLPWRHQRYRLFLSDKNLQYAKNLKNKIPSSNPIVGLVVGAGNRWPMKTLPVDKQIKLVKKIHKKFRNKLTIILLSGKSEKELEFVKIIKKKCPYVITHEGKEIGEFIGIVNLCDVIVSPDTLSMHIGISLNKYVIAYLTVTSAPEIDVYTGEKIVAHNHPDYCSYRKDLKKRPNIADAIGVDEIFNKITKIIKTKR